MVAFIMDKQNIGRLNQLFEKMVASAISSSEKNELDILYSRFIDEGRTNRSVEHLKASRQSIRANY